MVNKYRSLHKFNNLYIKDVDEGKWANALINQPYNLIK